jgi:hypothetical protein
MHRDEDEVDKAFPSYPYPLVRIRKCKLQLEKFFHPAICNPK